MSKRIAGRGAASRVGDLASFVGKKVLLLCANYFYAGTLHSVNEETAELAEAQIVYETGPWNASGYQTAEKLPGDTWRVRLAALESYGPGK
jgi:hypothetical protein